MFYASGGVDGNAGVGLNSEAVRSGSVSFPLTPALSPSEGERENRRQLSGEPRLRRRMPRQFDVLCAAEAGKDAFYRVRNFARNGWDAVERVLTGSK